MDTDKIYAEASKLAYGNNDEADKLAGHTLDRSLSDFEKKVWVNNETGNLILGHRGTELKDKKHRVKDLLSDVALTFGAERLDPRFRSAERHLKAVENKYQGKKITTTGHSLAGQVSTYLAKKSNNVDKAVTFNKGFTPFSDRGSNKSINYYTQGDVISNAGALFSKGKHIIQNRANKNKHSLSNFFYV